MSREAARDLRVRLLRAAEQEIAASGLARASLRAIARRVGVSHQATAHHFADRAGLFTALAVEGLDMLAERTAAAVAAAPVEGGQQVIAAGVAYVEFAARQPTMFDLMYRPELLRSEDPALIAARERHREQQLDSITRAQATGWAVTIPAADLAVIGWAAVHGLAVLQREAYTRALYPEVDLDGLLAQVGQAFAVLTTTGPVDGSIGQRGERPVDQAVDESVAGR